MHNGIFRVDFILTRGNVSVAPARQLVTHSLIQTTGNFFFFRVVEREVNVYDVWENDAEPSPQVMPDMKFKL